MAKSVGTAVVADGARLVECETQERLKTRGHEKARQIAGMDASAKEHPAENDNLDDIVHKLQHAHVTGVYSGDNAEPSSSRTCGKGPFIKRRIECGACREDKLLLDVTQLPCGDRYRQRCLQKLFEASIADESLFPPRYCREPLDMKTVQPF